MPAIVQTGFHAVYDSGVRIFSWLHFPKLRIVFRPVFFSVLVVIHNYPFIDKCHPQIFCALYFVLCFNFLGGAMVCKEHAKLAVRQNKCYISSINFKAGCEA